MGMTLPPQFLRLLRLLNTHGVEYLVVGGYAVIHHGYVRTTGDIDIWVARNPGNATKLEKAVRELGFNPPGLHSGLFMKPGGVLRIGQDPLRFDLMNHVEGLHFAECRTRQVETEIEGVRIPFIGLADLKANKRATGRNKDLADLDYLP